MRVITGTARGRILKTLEGSDVRPTTDKTKEGLFSSIQFDIEGRRVLDLFAGSGQLGIEALSRGAESAVFVDTNPEAISVINENLKATNFAHNSQVVRSDYFSFVASTNQKFDIAFLDPPYYLGVLEKALNLVCGVMSDYGIIVCEHPTDVALPEQIQDFSLSRQKKYGKILVSIYRKECD